MRVCVVSSFSPGKYGDFTRRIAATPIFFGRTQYAPAASDAMCLRAAVYRRLVGDGTASDAGDDDAAGGRHDVGQREPRRCGHRQLSRGQTSLSRRRLVQAATRDAPRSLRRQQ